MRHLRYGVFAQWRRRRMVISKLTQQNIARCILQDNGHFGFINSIPVIEGVVAFSYDDKIVIKFDLV